VRLRRLERELGGRIELVWKSYLLRPDDRGARDREKFVEYTRGWARPAAEPEAGTFRTWASDAPPPSHSVPPHLVAHAAAAIGRAAFDRLHDRLFVAYFAENRDISDTAVLEAVWREQGLPAAELARVQDPVWGEQTIADHVEAQTLGITGVPAARIEGNEAFITGALPRATYRRWIERQLAGTSGQAAGQA
jgi:predicted DsbA family dithiol-disulfide isomerase